MERPQLAIQGLNAKRYAVHRIAALAMLGAFAFHFVHVLVDARARRCIAGMLPSRHDLRELREKLRW
jgi:hypothetical protein